MARKTEYLQAFGIALSLQSNVPGLCESSWNSIAAQEHRTCDLCAQQPESSK